MQKPVDLTKLTQGQLHQELLKGYEDIIAGKTKPATVVFDAIRKEHGIEKKPLNQ